MTDFYVTFGPDDAGLCDEDCQTCEKDHDNERI